MNFDFNNNCFENVFYLIKNINQKKIDKIVLKLCKLQKNNGRIFFVGCGDNVANTSYTAYFFRKIINIKNFCATDNVSEL